MAMKKVTIFYCYHINPDDEIIKEQLTKYINNLDIISQDYTNISAGKDIQRTINEYLESVDILLLLISADFIRLYGEFMEQIQVALQRYTRGDIRIIATILRFCIWEDCIFAGKPLQEWKVLPTDRTPINSYKQAKREQVLTEIAREVRKVAEPIKQKYKKEWHLEEAEKYGEQGEYEKADNELKEALKCLSNDEVANKEKADIWRKIGDLHYQDAGGQAALEAYHKALNLFSGDVQTFVAVAQIYYQALSSPLKAIEAYTEAIKLEPQNIELYKSKFALLLQERQPEEALKTCDAAIARYSNNVELMRYRVQILYELQRYEEARKIYQDVLKPNLNNSYLNDPYLHKNIPYLCKEYGDVLLKSGPQYSKEACDAYETAIRAYDQTGLNELPFRNEITQKLEEANRGRTQQ
jgi:tetratricopeptide (TPR) repeat protein